MADFYFIKLPSMGGYMRKKASCLAVLYSYLPKNKYRARFGYVNSVRKPIEDQYFMGEFIKKTQLQRISAGATQAITRDLTVEDDSGVAILQLADSYAILADVLQKGDFILFKGVIARQIIYDAKSPVHLILGTKLSSFPFELSFFPTCKAAKSEKVISYSSLLEVKSVIGQLVNVYGVVIPAIDDTDIIAILEGKFVIRLMDWSNDCHETTCEFSIICSSNVLHQKREGCVARLQNVKVVSSGEHVFGSMTENSTFVFFSSLSNGRISMITSFTSVTMSADDWKQVEQLLHKYQCFPRRITPLAVQTVCANAANHRKEALLKGESRTTVIKVQSSEQPAFTTNTGTKKSNAKQIEDSPDDVINFLSLVVATVPMSAIPGIRKRSSFKRILSTSNACPAIFLVKAAVIDVYPAEKEIEKMFYFTCNLCNEMVTKSFVGNAHCSRCCTPQNCKEGKSVPHFSFRFLLCDEKFDTLTASITNGDAISFFGGVTPAECIDYPLKLARIQSSLKKLCPCPGIFSAQTILISGHILSEPNSSGDKLFRLVNTNLIPDFSP